MNVTLILALAALLCSGCGSGDDDGAAEILEANGIEPGDRVDCSGGDITITSDGDGDIVATSGDGGNCVGGSGTAGNLEEAEEEEENGEPMPEGTVPPFLGP